MYFGLEQSRVPLVKVTQMYSFLSAKLSNKPERPVGDSIYNQHSEYI